MRKCLLVVVPLLVPLCWQGAAGADIKLSAAVGFTASSIPGASNTFKQGFWTPVKVQIQSDPKSEIIRAGNKLVVQMVDSDGMDSQFVQPLPVDINPGATEDVIVLARPLTHNEEINISIVTEDGHVLAKGSASLKNTHMSLPANSVLYLALGSALPALDTALQKLTNKDKADGEGAVAGEARVYESARLTQVGDMPRRWFGYQGVDVMILTTDDSGFVRALVDRANKEQLDAIKDWVRHGGRLVISVSAAKHLESRIELFKKLDLIDVTIDKQAVSWDRLNTVEGWVSQGAEGKPFVAQGGKKIDIARFTVNPQSRHRPIIEVRKPGEEAGATDLPLIVQAPCGLGRVMLVAFDLDAAPFANWSGQQAFWQKIQQAIGPNVDINVQRSKIGGGFQEERTDLNGKLKRGLETIDDVPVVSFGWVALFILLYILIVGPLDYFFLKKVVKRLELTWITFPVIVITISIGAYIAAYLLKGNDLKINKLDVVDIFLDDDSKDASASGEGSRPVVAREVYGTTWFTLFSPQIKRYTVGLDPNRGVGRFSDNDYKHGWVGGPADSRDGDPFANQANPYGVVMGSMNRPESFGDTGQQSSGGLFHFACKYEEDDSGITGVPIQVWQTKSFTASWQASVAGDEKLFSAQLSRTQDAGVVDQGLNGWIRSDLPVPLVEAAIFFAGKYYELNTVSPGQQVTIPPPGGTRFDRSTWFQRPFFSQSFKTEGKVHGNGIYDQEAPCAYAKTMLFSGITSDPHHDLPNGHFRNLDQFWRLNDSQQNVEEAILVGRVASPSGRAEEFTADVAAPTRIWLDRLPKKGASRAALSGKLTQDTVVRVFIPVERKKP